MFSQLSNVMGSILFKRQIEDNYDSHFSKALKVARGTCLDDRQSVVT